MLFEQMMTPCILLIPTKTPDGEGGYKEEFVNGSSFDAAIVFNNSTENDIAYKADEKARFTITTQSELPFAFYDVFKRIADGKIFRITSEVNNVTPTVASFRFRQFTAEEWRLPDD